MGGEPATVKECEDCTVLDVEGCERLQESGVLSSALRWLAKWCLGELKVVLVMTHTRLVAGWLAKEFAVQRGEEPTFDLVEVADLVATVRINQEDFFHQIAGICLILGQAESESVEVSVVLLNDVFEVWRIHVDNRPPAMLRSSVVRMQLCSVDELRRLGKNDSQQMEAGQILRIDQSHGAIFSINHDNIIDLALFDERKNFNGGPVCS